MSGTNYTGNPSGTFTSTVNLVLDSDPQRAVTYNPAWQTLADDVAIIDHRFQKLGGAFVTDGVWYPIPMRVAEYDTTWGPASSPVYGIKTLASNAAWFLLPISGFLPPAGMLTELYIGLVGAAGHTAVPTTMPCAQLIDVTLDDQRTTTVLIDSDVIVDTSSLPADYDAIHSMGAVGYSMNLLPDIDLSVRRSLVLKIFGEAGSNVVVGTTFFNVRVRVIPAHYNTSG